MERPLRTAAIHDMSSFGRCALSVIVPILSIMGIQVCSVPTAVLSTHTGGFKGFYWQEMDGYVSGCLKHWKETGVELECVYSGFLSGAAQADEVREFLLGFPDALKVVDPVLGDEGGPYQTVGRSHIKAMRRLVKYADIITPNATEAALLLGTEYTGEAFSPNEAKSCLKALCGMGPGQIVITGKEISGYGLCNICYQREPDIFHIVPCDYLPAHYPGTGDIFASVMTGRLLMGTGFHEAVCSATDFVERAISATFYSGDPKRDGVYLEKVIPRLLEDKIPPRAQIF